MIDQKETASIQRDWDDAFAEICTISETGVKLLKARISFADKLVIISAGALTLSLTAASSILKQQKGDGGVGFMHAAWKLLISAIVLSILAQWLIIWSATLHDLFRGSLASHRKLGRWYDRANAAGCFQGTMIHYRTHMYQLEKWMPWYKNMAAICSRSATTLGLLAQLSLFVALYWLYRFTCVNWAGH